MTEEQPQASVAPTDVTDWLARHGWSLAGNLADVASRWISDDGRGVVVPLQHEAPDFELRWDEMLDDVGEALGTDRNGFLLAVTKAGSDVAEFRAVGDGRIDDSIPLGDAAILIDSVRRLLQASANSALQPRSYYGHSLPDAAREHARNVRMGQTRRGSYIVPVISRVPILQAPSNSADALLFEDVKYQPFARSAMLRLAEGLNTLRDLTHGNVIPKASTITESVGAGVSSELCDAVASTLETESIADLDVSFSWAERLPLTASPKRVTFEDATASAVRAVGLILKGEAVVGRQTFVGYVKRLDRGEEDEVGRITLRTLDNDKARNVLMDLNDDDYHEANRANDQRRMVSVTGVLEREPVVPCVSKR